MLTPLPAEDWDDQAREALASTVPPERRNPDNAGNALSTLVRHPVLAGAFLPFNTYLQRDSTLPERIRELAVLRRDHRGATAPPPDFSARPDRTFTETVAAFSRWHFCRRPTP